MFIGSSKVLFDKTKLNRQNMVLLPKAGLPPQKKSITKVFPSAQVDQKPNGEFEEKNFEDARLFFSRGVEPSSFQVDQKPNGEIEEKKFFFGRLFFSHKGQPSPQVDQKAKGEIEGKKFSKTLDVFFHEGSTLPQVDQKSNGEIEGTLLLPSHSPK